MRAKFIKMLQHAHAGELAAYHAYQGHWESLKNPYEREMVKWIQQEELEHMNQVKVMLFLLGAQPSRLRDTLFGVIGKTLSKLCKVTGYFAPMLGALWIEKIGVANYKEMIVIACRLHMFSFVHILHEMWQTEIEHEEYFKTCLKPKAESDR